VTVRGPQTGAGASRLPGSTSTTLPAPGAGAAKASARASEAQATSPVTDAVTDAPAARAAALALGRPSTRALAQDVVLGALGLGHRPRLLGPDAIAAKVLRLEKAGVAVETIGASRAGRPIHAMTVGHGPVRIAAMSGAHPDEPVGALTVLALAEAIHTDPRLAGLASQVTLHLVPCANPDGAAKNAAWFDTWSAGGPLAPRLRAYFEHVARDTPADDVEFGFPTPTKAGGLGAADAGARPENRALAGWLERLGSLDHYVSLHSMFLGGGALFLVTTDDLAREQPKLDFVLERAASMGMGLHDKDRAGQKGFARIGPGLQTAPTQAAMKAFFEAAAKAGDASAQAQADAFKLNSMQVAQLQNDAPLALVSEIPLVYDPRIASMEPTQVLRRDEERRFAEGLIAVFGRVGTLVAEARAALGGATARAEGGATQALDAIDARLATGRSAALAQTQDLARWGEMRATVGNVLEDDLNLMRREATLLAQVLAALEPARVGSPAAEAVGAQASARLDALLEDITARFALEAPTLDTQARLQMAAVLAPVFSSSSEPRVRQPEAPRLDGRSQSS
jgi:hypothetical protein